MDVGALRTPTSRMGPTVRPLNPEDRHAVTAILTACSAFSDEEVRVALEMVDAGLTGEYRLLGAVVDGTLRGYACAGRAPLTMDSWYLYWICIHADHIGEGLGRLLQVHLEQLITTLGGGRIVLETSARPNYDAARAFYRSRGFLHVGTIPDFYSEGDDCLIYCKSLPSAHAQN